MEENILEKIEAGAFDDYWEYLGDNIYNYLLRQKELKKNPSLKKELKKRAIDLDLLNEAQVINQYFYYDKYGKLRVKVYGNTYLAFNIAKRKPRHFGSISEYNIEVLPKSYLHHLGIEKIQLKQDSSSYRGVDLISRRFASRVIKEWARLKGIRYYSKKRKDHALNLVCEKNLIYNDMPYKDDVYTITGEDLILLILEIIEEIRDGNPKAFYIDRALVNNPRDADEIVVLKQCIYKDENNKYHIEQDDTVEYYKTWKTPIFNMEYLFGILKELESGKYFLDVPIIVIKDLYKYPIRCTDINAVKDDQEYKEKLDDYDITQYIWEDRQ